MHIIVRHSGGYERAFGEVALNGNDVYSLPRAYRPHKLSESTMLAGFLGFASGPRERPGSSTIPTHHTYGAGLAHGNGSYPDEGCYQRRGGRGKLWEGGESSSPSRCFRLILSSMMGSCDLPPVLCALHAAVCVIFNAPLLTRRHPRYPVCRCLPTILRFC